MIISFVDRLITKGTNNKRVSIFSVCKGMLPPCIDSTEMVDQRVTVPSILQMWKPSFGE